MPAWKKAYHANCWGPLGGNAVGVTSITQLSYRTFANMERALSDIAAAGYEGAELFDGNLLDYEQAHQDLRTILKNTGLKLVAAYSGANFIFSDILPEELARIERASAFAGELGVVHMVIGGGAKRASGIQAEDIKLLGAGLERAREIIEKHGLRAHYHPHLSTIVEGPEAVRAVFKETGMDFCPDTAHLAAAGGDVPSMIREHAKRISYIHLKGWQKNPFAFTPLDTGTLDMRAITQAMHDINFSGWVTAELDSWPDPKEGATRSMNFLRAVDTKN